MELQTWGANKRTRGEIVHWWEKVRVITPLALESLVAHYRYVTSARSIAGYEPLQQSVGKKGLSYPWLKELGLEVLAKKVSTTGESQTGWWGNSPGYRYLWSYRVLTIGIKKTFTPYNIEAIFCRGLHQISTPMYKYIPLYMCIVLSV